jgi:hypothetical protein
MLLGDQQVHGRSPATHGVGVRVGGLAVTGSRGAAALELPTAVSAVSLRIFWHIHTQLTAFAYGFGVMP